LTNPSQHCLHLSFSPLILGDVIGEKAEMLSKCANPPCSASFRYFRQGKLFRVDTEPSGIVPTARLPAEVSFSGCATIVPRT